MSLTTRQENSGKIEIKKINVECDIDENFKDDQGLFAVLPSIMFLFEVRAKFLNKNLFFNQY
jgi:hypothetical protein